MKIYPSLKTIFLSFLLVISAAYSSEEGDASDIESNADTAIHRAPLNDSAGTVVHRRAHLTYVDGGRISPATQAEVFDPADFLSPIIPHNGPLPTEDLETASAFDGMSLEDKTTAMLRGHSAQSSSSTRFAPQEHNILQTTTFYEASRILAYSYLSIILRGYGVIIPNNQNAMSHQEVFLTWYGVSAELLKSGLPQARIAMLRHAVITGSDGATQQSLEEFLWRLAIIGKNTVATSYLGDRGILQSVDSLTHPKFAELEVMSAHGGNGARDHILYLVAHSDFPTQEKQRIFSEKLRSGWVLPACFGEKPIRDLTEEDFAAVQPRKSRFSVEIDTKKRTIVEVVGRHARYLQSKNLLGDMSRTWLANQIRDYQAIEGDALRHDKPGQHTFFYLVSIDPDIEPEAKKAIFIDAINRGWTLPPCFGAESFNALTPATLLEQFSEALYTARTDSIDISFLVLNPRQAIAYHVPLAAQGNLDSMRVLFEERFHRYGKIYEGGLFGMLLTQMGKTAEDMEVLHKLVGGWIEVSAIINSTNE